MLITKSFQFDSSHLLVKHPGKCSRLHGHSWELEVGIEGRPNPDSSFVMDYAMLTDIVKPAVDFIDHRHLNFLILYPSSENVCQFFGRYLQRLVDGHTIARVIIRLKETQKTQATWDSAIPVDINTMMNNSGSAPLVPVIPEEAKEDGTIILGGGAIELWQLRQLHIEWKQTIRALVAGVSAARKLHYELAVANKWFQPGEGGSVIMGGTGGIVGGQ